jgi:4-hydroxybenzoate polyprenyltransferase
VIVVMAAKAGVRLPELAVVAVAALAGQLSIGWSNDALDAGRDAVAGRTDKPVATGAIGRGTVWAAATVAVLVNVALCFWLSVGAGVTNLFIVGAAWAYNAGLKSTLASGLMFVFGFGPIPIFASSIDPAQPAPSGWTVAAAATLGLGGHFANVLPDLAGDRQTGVRGLPQRIAALPRGAVLVRIIALVLLVGASAMMTFAQGNHGWYAITGFALAVVLAVVGARASGRGPFRAALAIAALDVVLFVTLS